jgi:protein-S-isoprenylcysteine O-methyltransferase Ste14
MSITRMAYRFRGVLIIPPFIFALFCVSSETEMEGLTWPLGVSLFLLGLSLRVWAQQHVHYRLKVKKYLTTTGPYAFVRNPIYIGNLLICSGLIISSELLWFAPIAFFYCFGIYSLVVRYEEGHLLEKFGENYRKYLSEVPRWFPNTIRFENLEIKNEYFRATIVAEIHCALAFLPYLVKEVIGVIL